MALVMSSSEPGVKSMMPSLPGPPANVMLERSGHVRPAHCAHSARSAALPASPALVDVDVVHSVSAEGCLGQGLDHVVTLQHHVPLGAHRGMGSGPAQRLEGPCPPRRPVPEGHLLLIVLTLHVEHEEAVAQAADGDSWGGKGEGQGSRSRAGPPSGPNLDSGSPVRLGYSILCLTLASSTMTTALGVSSSCRERGL